MLVRRLEYSSHSTGPSSPLNRSASPAAAVSSSCQGTSPSPWYVSHSRPTAPAAEAPSRRLTAVAKPFRGADNRPTQPLQRENFGSPLRETPRHDCFMPEVLGDGVDGRRIASIPARAKSHFEEIVVVPNHAVEAVAQAWLAGGLRPTTLVEPRRVLSVVEISSAHLDHWNSGARKRAVLLVWAFGVVREARRLAIRT